jgi:hypothetical protein
VSTSKPDGPRRFWGTPAGQDDIQLAVQVAQRSARSTGKDELLTIGTELLLAKLGQVTRSRDRRR